MIFWLVASLIVIFESCDSSGTRVAFIIAGVCLFVQFTTFESTKVFLFFPVIWLFGNGCVCLFSANIIQLVPKWHYSSIILTYHQTAYKKIRSNQIVTKILLKSFD